MLNMIQKCKLCSKLKTHSSERLHGRWDVCGHVNVQGLLLVTVDSPKGIHAVPFLLSVGWGTCVGQKHFLLGVPFFLLNISSSGEFSKGMPVLSRQILRFELSITHGSTAKTETTADFSNRKVSLRHLVMSMVNSADKVRGWQPWDWEEHKAAASLARTQRENRTLLLGDKSYLLVSMNTEGQVSPGGIRNTEKAGMLPRVPVKWN